MFGFYRGILLTFVATVVVAGCAENSDRMDLRVGLFFAENTRNLMLADNEGDLQLGEDLVSNLTRSIQGIFTSVEVLDSYPTRASIADEQLSLAVVVQFGNMDGSSKFEGNGLLNQSEASRTISVELNCYDPAMVEIALVKASGRGNASAHGIVFSSEKSARVNSAKAALRNLGDDVALQMSSNPEIRNMAERVNAIIPP